MELYYQTNKIPVKRKELKYFLLLIVFAWLYTEDGHTCHGRHVEIREHHSLSFHLYVGFGCQTQVNGLTQQIPFPSEPSHQFWRTFGHHTLHILVGIYPKIQREWKEIINFTVLFMVGIDIFETIFDWSSEQLIILVNK